MDGRAQTEPRPLALADVEGAQAGVQGAHEVVDQGGLGGVRGQNSEQRVTTLLRHPCLAVQSGRGGRRIQQRHNHFLELPLRFRVDSAVTLGIYRLQRPAPERPYGARLVHAGPPG
ncbi:MULTISPECIES: hypothetical protein [unclassified Streptomyces]|uniref:hypothetical protein n=1 Tax=unclassified Streptomyces TaxID=2593676 RepID=UPI0023657709|nr:MULTISPECIES: hypothetical protein [unclassified Streptomyces]MDF3146733.1 hypothetical protein [Streptomyces sp. T21Q-yed]WDF37866.1 hypothetical protein PBV52_14180 [Streptomyces sp. T12]